MKNFAFIIQARTGSTRLPEKMLMPFYQEKTILELLIDKLVKAFGNENVILATTLNVKDDKLEEVAKQVNIKCFRGDENDVLKRFINCAEKYDIKSMMRVCADNPYLDIELARDLLLTKDITKYDYVSYCINDVPAIKTHYGFFMEFVTLSALKKVAALTTDVFFREHVTNYIYANPESFNIHWKDAPQIVSLQPNTRLTVDTSEDFNLAKTIYSELGNSFNYKNVIELLNRKPEYQKLMMAQIQRNGK